MLAEIIRKEALQHLMSLRFAIACVLCFITIFCGLFVQSQKYNMAYQDYTRANAFEKNHLENMDLPIRIIQNGFNLHQRPNPLKMFVRGISDKYGQTLRIHQRNLPEVMMSRSLIPSVAVFPAMDLITFVGLVMSLLAVIFGYDAICGEKERGTLRLMLSYAIPRDTVLLGKWLGGYITLVLPFLIAVISGAVLIVIQPDVALSANEWIRLLGVLVLALLFIAVIFSASIWVSTLTSRSSTSILILVSLWMIFVLAIPNLSPHIAQFLQPGEKTQITGEDQLRAASAAWREEVNDKMEEYDKVNNFSWANINWDDFNSRKKADERNLEELRLERKGYDKYLDALDEYDQAMNNRIDSQGTLCNWIARLSPFSTFAISAAELTDNGVEGKRHFLNQAKKYQKIIYDYALAEQIIRMEYYLAHEGEVQNPWSEYRDNPLPIFSYSPRSAGDYLRSTALDAGILVSLGFIFFLLSYLTFMHYDVR
ncbi:MAG: ABC transporter permease subunit [Planctomycetes bacterium]|nr:ABC transporter permease subunit [Planctomycetota bacterium]